MPLLTKKQFDHVINLTDFIDQLREQFLNNEYDEEDDEYGDEEEQFNAYYQREFDMKEYKKDRIKDLKKVKVWPKIMNSVDTKQWAKTEAKINKFLSKFNFEEAKKQFDKEQYKWYKERSGTSAVTYENMYIDLWDSVAESHPMHDTVLLNYNKSNAKKYVKYKEDTPAAKSEPIKEVKKIKKPSKDNITKQEKILGNIKQQKRAGKQESIIKTSKVELLNNIRKEEALKKEVAQLKLPKQKKQKIIKQIDNTIKQEEKVYDFMNKPLNIAMPKPAKVRGREGGAKKKKVDELKVVQDNNGVKPAYYGPLNNVPRGYRRATASEAIDNGQLRYWGLKKVDPKLVERKREIALKKKQAVLSREQQVIQGAILRGRLSRVNRELAFEKDPKKIEELKKLKAETEKQLG